MNKLQEMRICMEMRKGIKQYDAEEKALKAGYKTTQAHNIDKASKVAGFGLPAAFGNKLPPDVKQQIGGNIKDAGKMMAHNYDIKHPDKWIDESRHEVKMPEPSEDHVYHMEEAPQCYGLDMKEIEAQAKNNQTQAQTQENTKGK